MNGALGSSAPKKRCRLPRLLGADVLVSPHGADVVNGLAMRAGAALVEVMPITGLDECPCHVFKQLFTAESAVFYFRLHSRNRSYVVERRRGTRAWQENMTMHADLMPPWTALHTALTRIIGLGGSRERYEVLRLRGDNELEF